MSDEPRALPSLDDVNRSFWVSGRDGILRFQYCLACRRFQHPPSATCSQCWSESLEWRPVTGHATVEAITINYQPWRPDMAVPYAVAIVEIADQPGLRLTTNIVDVAPQNVKIGDAVQVQFLEVDDVYIPVFRPTQA